MSTHVDGAGPSVTPDEDGDPDASPGAETGSEWVRAEMQRRMAANRSTRGRHARRGEVSPPAQRGVEPASRGALPAAVRPEAVRPNDVRPNDVRPNGVHPNGVHPNGAPPNGARQDRGRPGDRRRPETPPPWLAESVPAGDLPENYVPRHSVQTPGPAADPAAPISGPIPVIRPAGGGIGGGAPDGAPGAPGGAIGGPSLPPSGLPIRRRRGSGPGTPLQADTAAPAAPWLRPGPIVPHEPARRLGAPPEMLGSPEPIPAWGLPLASPPRGFAVPAAPDTTPDTTPDTPPDATAEPAADDVVADPRAPVSEQEPAVEQAAESVLTPPETAVPNGHEIDADADDEDDDDRDDEDDEDDDEVDTVWVPRAVAEGLRAGPVVGGVATAAAVTPDTAARPESGTEPTSDAPSTSDAPPTDGAAPTDGAGRANGSSPFYGGTPALARLDAAANGMASPPSGPIDLSGLTDLEGPPGHPAPPAPAAAPGETPEETTAEIAGGLTDMPTAPHPIVAARTAPSGRTVGVPAQRGAQAAGAPGPRAVNGRDIPVVGTAPPEPGSTRVRVVLSERKGVARPVRTIKEVQEGTPVGELLRRDLIRSQLFVTARFALLTVLVLGTLPAVFALLPVAGHARMLGVGLPWLVLGVLMYPFLVGVAWRYVRVADRVEQNFADHVQD